MKIKGPISQEPHQIVAAIEQLRGMLREDRTREAERVELLAAWMAIEPCLCLEEREELRAQVLDRLFPSERRPDPARLQ